jgi:hypothetical protein
MHAVLCANDPTPSTMIGTERAAAGDFRLITRTRSGGQWRGYQTIFPRPDTINSGRYGTSSFARVTINRVFTNDTVTHHFARTGDRSRDRIEQVEPQGSALMVNPVRAPVAGQFFLVSWIDA